MKNHVVKLCSIPLDKMWQIKTDRLVHPKKTKWFCELIHSAVRRNGSPECTKPYDSSKLFLLIFIEYSTYIWFCFWQFMSSFWSNLLLVVHIFYLLCYASANTLQIFSHSVQDTFCKLSHLSLSRKAYSGLCLCWFSSSTSPHFHRPKTCTVGWLVIFSWVSESLQDGWAIKVC